jgi:hypothetical protein
MSEAGEYQRGRVDATLDEHAAHLGKINGSIERFADEVGKMTLAVQRLADEAAADRQLADAVRAARIARWTPVDRLIAVVVGLAAVAAVVVSVVIR